MLFRNSTPSYSFSKLDPLYLCFLLHTWLHQPFNWSSLQLSFWGRFLSISSTANNQYVLLIQLSNISLQTHPPPSHSCCLVFSQLLNLALVLCLTPLPSHCISFTTLRQSFTRVATVYLCWKLNSLTLGPRPLCSGFPFPFLPSYTLCSVHINLAVPICFVSLYDFPLSWGSLSLFLSLSNSILEILKFLVQNKINKQSPLNYRNYYWPSKILFDPSKFCLVKVISINKTFKSMIIIDIKLSLKNWV